MNEKKKSQSRTKLSKKNEKNEVGILSTIGWTHLLYRYETTSVLKLISVFFSH